MEVTLVMSMEESVKLTRRLTRQLTRKVQELWEDVSSLPLPEEEKLNSCFEKIPVALFPPSIHGQVIEVCSETSIADTVQVLAQNKILSVPVRDVTAPDNASWIDKYLGIVEFAAIAFWVLHQSELTSLKTMPGDAGTGEGIGGMVGTLEAETQGASVLGVADSLVGTVSTGFQVPAAACPALSGSDAVSTRDGDFFEALTSSDHYANTKVKDITGSFRWAPFLPVQKSDNLLTLLLLLSRYRIKSLPVVESGEGTINNFITQSAVVHILSQCSGLPWFECLGNKSLLDLGLPKMKPEQVVKVDEGQPVLEAFQLMRIKGVGGVPVVAKGGNYLIGNVSARDVQYLLTAPENYRNYRSIRVKDFLEATRKYLATKDSSSPLLHSVITCKCTEAVRDVIAKLDGHKIHRIYVVDDDGNLKGVVTLRDLISQFVMEPSEYFGEFFAGWLPAYSPRGWTRPQL